MGPDKDANGALGDTKLISTTDFFYPLVEDPYLQGRISCCNVLSDVYAMGISRVDQMLMILGVSLQMQEADREIVTREMMRGFNDCATEASTKITGGQSIMNPWPMIGGVANVMCNTSEFIRPNNGKPGDLLVLTKPLGTQPAVNMRQKLSGQGGEQFFNERDISTSAVNKTYCMAIESMGTLNSTGATLMQKYASHGATDVTGFGILGHAGNLAGAQHDEVDLILDRLPILQLCEKKVNGMPDFDVLGGYSAETSGGILTMQDAASAKDFVAECEEKYGQQAWIVGEVVKGSRQALIRPDVEVISITEPFILR